ncbi:MAG: hypothetical protein NT075_13115 [Chloroflexi bacterium]|nr:hypothetical protein [Chloroflexota bacterium]
MQTKPKGLDARKEQARTIARNAFWVYTGLLGLTYDKVKSILKDRKTLMAEAAQRGETIAQEVGGRVGTLRQQANTTVTELRERGLQSAAKLNKKAKVAQAEVATAIANMEDEGGPPVAAPAPAVAAPATSELPPAEPLPENLPIVAHEESTAPTIVIASASADLSELLAAETTADVQETTPPEESTGPTILIAKS